MMSSTSGMGVLFISAKETLFLCVRELRAVPTYVLWLNLLERKSAKKMFAGVETANFLLDQN